MALPCDISKAYNDASLSDLIIQFSGQQIYCHKLVLCLASDYFKALCGPESRFAESRQKLIELKDDDPLSIRAMLQHLYNLPFDQGIQKDFNTHLSILSVANKYLLPALAEQALDGIYQDINGAEAGYRLTKDITGILEIVQFLSSHRDENDNFGTIIVKITKTYAYDLFLVPEFRQLLEEEGNKDMLDIVMDVVKIGQEHRFTGPQAKEECQLAECNRCHFIWKWTAGDRCPGCLRSSGSAVALSTWWREG